MARFLEPLGVYWRPPDPRSRREVDDEIATELEFHLAMRAADLEREGLAPDAARLEAERCFGDRGRVVKACRQAQIGERLMLQRVQAALLIALLCAVGVMGWQSWSSQRRSEQQLAALGTRLEAMQQAFAAEAKAGARSTGPAGRDADVDASRAASASSPASPSTSVEPTRRDESTLESTLRRTGRSTDAEEVAALVARLARDPKWGDGHEVGVELARRPPDEGLALLRRIWPQVTSPVQRRRLLEPFVVHFTFEPLHARVLDVLDLGARDSDVTVQTAALDLVRGFAFRDFSGDVAAYTGWRDANAGRAIGDVIVDAARDFAKRLHTVQTGEEAAAMREQAGNWYVNVDRPNGPDLPKILRDEGMVEVAVRWLDVPDQALRDEAVKWLALARVDFGVVRGWLDRRGERVWAAEKVLASSWYRIAPADLAALLDSDEYTLRNVALGHLAASDDLAADEGLRRRLLALVDSRDELDPATANSVFLALARPGYRFAVGPLLEVVAHSAPTRPYFRSAVHALGQIGDPSAIPTLIAARLATSDRSEQSLLVANGLAPLTGVDDWSRGADFWTKWWSTNRERFGADVAKLEIPKLEWDTTK